MAESKPEQEAGDAARSPNSTDRTERNKAELLHTSQGALSSIRAAFKRSKSYSHGDGVRERRHPEITILSIEPLPAAPWFPASTVGFPAHPSSPPSGWDGGIHTSGQFPPSYDQVIKEKTREQDTPPVAPRRQSYTSSTATQTDSLQEGARTPKTNPQNTHTPQHTECWDKPKKPPRPSLPKPLPRTASTKGIQAKQPGSPADPCTPKPSHVNTDQSASSVLVTADASVQLQASETFPKPRPVARPRSKPKVQLLVRPKDSSVSDLLTAPKNGTVPSGKYLTELLEAFALESQLAPEEARDVQKDSGEEDPSKDMAGFHADRNIRDRIRAFESQTNSADAAAPLEQPRNIYTKPPTVAPKPSVAPRPSVHKAAEPELESEKAATPGSFYEEVFVTPLPQVPTPKPQPPKKPSREESKPIPPVKTALFPSSMRGSLVKKANFSSQEEEPVHKGPPTPVKPSKDLLNFNNHNSNFNTNSNPSSSSQSRFGVDSSSNFSPSSIFGSGSSPSFNLSSNSKSNSSSSSIFGSDSGFNFNSNSNCSSSCSFSPSSIFESSSSSGLNINSSSNSSSTSRSTFGSNADFNFGSDFSPSFNSSSNSSSASTASPQGGRVENEYVDAPFNSAPTKPPRGGASSNFAPTRKPTIIRVPSRDGKHQDEASDFPPPLPLQRAVGGLTPLLKHTHKESFSSVADLSLPPRPVGGKVGPPRPPPAKTGPARPPPPRRDSVQRPTLHQAAPLLAAPPQTQHRRGSRSQRKGPVMPPRPCPGHPLYNNYTLEIPHAIAEFDYISNQTGELSFQKNEVLVLLDQLDTRTFECQVGEMKGRVAKSHIKIITPLPSNFYNGAAPTAQISSSRSAWPSEENGDLQVQALYDFTPESPRELTLRAGEIVTNVEKVDSEWYMGTCRGVTGYFPINYVTALSPSAALALAPAPPPAPAPVKTGKGQAAPVTISGPRCVARFDFEGECDDELSFSEGELIQLQEYVGDEWARGKVAGRVGIFPLNFVEVLEDLPPPPDTNHAKVALPGLAASPSTRAKSQIEDEYEKEEWAVALYDFPAESEEDLELRQGDMLVVTRRIDADWCSGRLNGREGYFPTAFIQPCSGPSR